LPKDSVANVSQVVALDRRVLTERVGKISQPSLRLVLSGIIADQESLVRGALRGAGLKLVARHVAGDWLALIAALTVRRPGGRRDDNHRDTENTESCY